MHRVWEKQIQLCRKEVSRVRLAKSCCSTWRHFSNSSESRSSLRVYTVHVVPGYLGAWVVMAASSIGSHRMGVWLSRSFLNKRHTLTLLGFYSGRFFAISKPYGLAYGLAIYQSRNQYLGTLQLRGALTAPQPDCEQLLGVELGNKYKFMTHQILGTCRYMSSALVISSSMVLWLCRAPCRSCTSGLMGWTGPYVRFPFRQPSGLDATQWTDGGWAGLHLSKPVAGQPSQ